MTKEKSVFNKPRPFRSLLNPVEKNDFMLSHGETKGSSLKERGKTLVILDAHAIIHRAYHALPPFTSPKGEPTGAVYGLASMLLRIIRELKPNYIAAAFDLPHPTFRHIAYEQYKAKRPEAAKELVAQFARSRELVGLFGIPIYDKSGFEADDIIGTIVEKLKKAPGLKIIIASGDLDTLQLVDDEKVVVYTLRKGIQDTLFYNEEEVKKRFGFNPKLLPDFKGLKGDPSDNIIGIAGIGDKTASALIQKFGGLENILGLAKRNPEKLKNAGIKDRITELLKTKEEDALFSRELAVIKKDVPIEFALKKCAFRGFDRPKLEALFRELGFMSLLARLSGSDKKTEEKPQTLSLRFDTNGLGDSKIYYWIELEGNIYAVGETGKIARASEIQNFGAKTNRAFDAKRIMRLAEEALVFEDDLRIMFWLLNPNRSDPKIADVLSSLFPEENAVLPNSLTLLPKAFGLLEAELENKNLLSVYREIEMPLIPVLFEMEKRGIACDAGLLIKASKEIKARIGVVEKSIYKHSGEKFNINSTRDLSRILFEKLKISTKGIRKTDGGKTSTRFSELTKLQSAHHIIKDIIEYRELAKIASTYTDVLPQVIAKDGRIHTTFNQTGTVTGRLSSADPNLQNVPVKSEFGDAIRRAFYAADKKIFLSFDYSQMQLRIAAYLSQDKKLLEFFKIGKDVHLAVAAEVFNVSESEVTAEMRRRAKTINFGILYGMGANALSENLGVSREEAAVFLEDYFMRFSGLAKYFEEVKEKAANVGYVETIFKRRRYLPEINSGLAMVKREAERMALNTPIQGTEADIMKMAMIKTSRKIAEDVKLSGKIAMVLQIHDELLFEAEKGVLDYAVKDLKPIMENIVSDKIILPIDVKIGPNWAELKLRS